MAFYSLPVSQFTNEGEKYTKRIDVYAVNKEDFMICAHSLENLKSFDNDLRIEVAKNIMTFLAKTSKKRASKYGRPALSFYSDGSIDAGRSRDEEGFSFDFGTLQLVY